MQKFIDDGYTLLNTAGGNRKAPKKREKSTLPSVTTPTKLTMAPGYHEWLDERMKAMDERLKAAGLFKPNPAYRPGTRGLT